VDSGRCGRYLVSAQKTGLKDPFLLTLNGQRTPCDGQRTPGMEETLKNKRA
jgi:hypothetical protein